MVTNILEYLENTALEYPDKTGVIDESSSISYSELLTRSKKMASALIKRGVSKGEPVGVYMEKGIQAVCAFFAVVYTGAFYSMLNTDLPAVRLSGINDVLQAKTILTTPELKDSANKIFSSSKIYTTDELANEEINEEALGLLRSEFIDTDKLYVNFTSGSTGQAKGIVVSHRSVIDFIDCFTGLFHITSEDVIANQAPFDFDVSVKDIYSAVKTGALLVIVPKNLFSIPANLIDFLCENKVTTLIWAVSALCLVSTFHGLDYKTPETINKILFSGEVMPYKHLTQWRKHLPEATYVNLYGPTEITCNCTYHILDKENDYSNGIPMGKHFPNEDVFLLDEADNKITEPYKKGEVVVRGTALALGYYNADENKNGGFVDNPLNKAYRETVYRTGDIAYYDDNAEFYFCGREDYQIKYMGHRIELEEIERVMNQIEGVERCCCIFDKQKERLRAYYIGQIDKSKLHANLKEKIPVFMIPQTIKNIEKMPLTKNGKIDRSKLKQI